MDWISEFADYCHREEGLNNIHDGQSVKLFLFVYSHDTSKEAKRSNERQRSKILSRRRLESSTVFFRQSVIYELQFLQFFRRIPELLQFFLRSVVYNLNNCTVHNIGSST